jgi:hypothetical protein
MPAMTPPAPIRDSTEGLPEEVVLAFAPLHKRAFGTAIGVTVGAVIFLATVIFYLRGPFSGRNLSLLSEYFYGYTVSWAGAGIGFLWGFFVGFVAGWFIAFCRNLVIAISIFIIRAKAELAQERDFLDHI